MRNDGRWQSIVYSVVLPKPWIQTVLKTMVLHECKWQWYPWVIMGRWNSRLLYLFFIFTYHFYRNLELSKKGILTLEIIITNPMYFTHRRGPGPLLKEQWTHISKTWSDTLLQVSQPGPTPLPPPLSQQIWERKGKGKSDIQWLWCKDLPDSKRRSRTPTMRQEMK